MDEWPKLSQEMFDALLPFSFITNEHGVIVRAGRSFAALHGGSVTGRAFTALASSAVLLADDETLRP